MIAWFFERRHSRLLINLVLAALFTLSPAATRQPNARTVTSGQYTVYVPLAAFKTDTSDPNANAQINDLSQSIVTNLDPPSGQQTIADIQTAFSNAQTQIQAASARQTQTTSMMQDLIAQTEQVSPELVSSELLSVQNSLQASYQATSMLSKLSLVNYLPIGG